MAETKGFTWDYDVNSQKRDEGVKPCARAMVTRRRLAACAQMVIGRGWPIAHAQMMIGRGGPIAHAQTMAEGGRPIAHACAYTVVMANRRKTRASIV